MQRSTAAATSELLYSCYERDGRLHCYQLKVLAISVSGVYQLLQLDLDSVHAIQVGTRVERTVLDVLEQLFLCCGALLMGSATNS